MNKTGLFLAALLLTGATLVKAAHEIPISAQQMEHLGINLVQVERATSHVSDQLPARVVIPPKQERVVSAPLGGLIVGLSAGSGDEVSAGDPLALIESPAIIGLQREFLQAATEQKLAATQLKRDEQLYKEGIIAERRFLETRSAYERAVATREERRQALNLSGMDEASIAELERKRNLASTLTARATSPGIVLESFVVVGQRVEQAEPLFRLAQLDPLWFEIRVPLRRLEGVKPGAEVEIPCPDALARVNMIGRDVDSASQTVLVRAEVRGVGDCLRPGQYVQARLRLGGEGQLYRVPANAVVRTREQSVVFVHAPFGFLAVQVKIVGQEGGYSVVSGQLSEDQSVAATGIAAIKGAWMGLGGGSE